MSGSVRWVQFCSKDMVVLVLSGPHAGKIVVLDDPTPRRSKNGVGCCWCHLPGEDELLRIEDYTEVEVL
jgi:hypothetical protein